MNANCKGHTLIELLIAMSLSMLIIAALVPVNMLSHRSVQQVQQTEKQINLLSQSVKIMQADLKTAALTACTLDKSFLLTTLFNQYSVPPEKPVFSWISGYTKNGWFPEIPPFVNENNLDNLDALQIIKADMSDLVSMESLAKTPQRIIFVTNCITSEITRSIDSKLLNSAQPPSELSVYAFQFIQYYVKENLGKHTLYRQYFSKSGRTRNEPLVDDILRLKIGYAETRANSTLVFNTAGNVRNWNNIVAIYISITLAGILHNPLSVLVPLNNHAPM